jgi:spore germination protein GerM
MLLVLLEFEGDGDRVRESQEWIIKANGLLVPKELKFAKLKRLVQCSPVMVRLLAQAHGKEECPQCQLVGSAIEGVGIILAQLP